MTASFVPGLELARLFYSEQVKPLLDQHFPGLPHSAALIGHGSEVLGFDSPRSTDHDWGPRLQLFLPDTDARSGRSAEVSRMLADQLPAEFRGYPTAFAASGAPPESAAHWVVVAGLRDWLGDRLGFDPLAGVGLSDWLATPTQILAEITGGAVFHDELARVHGSGGGLAAARDALAWYPRDVWRYVLASQWQRIDQEEPFPGRCAEAGDDLGSAVIAGRLARDLARLVLLMQRRYPPYSKWVGTALARSPAGPELVPLLTGAVTARSWPQREQQLSAAYEVAARLHNELGLTAYVDPDVQPTFWDRPYRVLGSARFVRALRAEITDEQVRGLPRSGAVDQFIDNTDAIGDLALLRTAVSAWVLSS